MGLEAGLGVVEGLGVEPQLVWVVSSREGCQSCAPLEMVKSHTFIKCMFTKFDKTIKCASFSLRFCKRPASGPPPGRPQLRSTAFWRRIWLRPSSTCAAQ